ncbi:TonB-dependent receptor [candidate division KSB1 bacterium]|nr:TonB-dependent receptor [candidate division KSB1 bacterium]NIR72546.1 TonB-dependent receptor [candidate division KSB1 bacterium]NIS23641.1 TonB-dependent receptor [candidate division KSB1 bacterium]NIT70565.1 TonB-dependent receptor [candidate division KSB1 bacterium]NIU24283.1 TonB-dependent receptor [candidate division KSB1 bacterium]
MKVFVISLLLILFSATITFAAAEITGRVFDQESGEPLVGANVIVVGTQMGAASDSEGRFIISRLASGVYALEASMIGYEKKRLENIRINQNSSTIQVNFSLREEAIALSEVIVTPGHFSMMRKEPTARQTLKREDIRSFPQLGEDVYRAVTRLPGLSGNDFSSKFTVRGGENEEVLVLLDGLELYEPFHLKDFGGSVSVIDVEAIGGIDMITGAFPAKYGDRLSGVFNIKSAIPSLGQSRTSLGLSFMNARFLSEGTFAEGRGHWLGLARRGYIDLVLALTNNEDDLSPNYYDVLGKVQYQLNSRHILAAHYLLANDHLELLDEEDNNNTVETSYGNMYGWLTLHSNFRDNLFTQTVLSFGHVDQNRQGIDFEDDGEVFESARDIRDFDFFGLKQDWEVTFSKDYLIGWGFDLKHLKADYDYFNQDRNYVFNADSNIVETIDTTQAVLDPTGRELGLYLSNRIRILEPLTAEFGLRFDLASWTDDKKLSPRFNLSMALAPTTTLRVGWGRFYQTQEIDDLHVQDDDEIYYPAELAEHRVVGLQHRFQNHLELRVEAYQKKLSDIRPRFQNLANQLEAFPEVEEDRIRLEPERGEAKGIEFFLKKDTGGKFNWWISYGYAFAEDNIDGTSVPRNFDQRHTVYLDLSYRPNDKWRLNVSWQYHSGWPYTPSTFERIGSTNGKVSFVKTYGAVNSERFPAYHRMDFRVNRYFDIGKGSLSVFFEVRNLYNRQNIRLFENRLHVFRNGTVRTETDAEHWLPILPSIGISYDF